MVYRVFIADMGKFTEPDSYEFVAEFADGKTAGYYLKYMRGKARYAEKDIVIKEVPNDGKDPHEGKTVVACGVTGECFYPEEYNF